MNERLLSEREAAQLLDVQPHTLATWRSTKRHPELKWIKVGRLVKYERADIESFKTLRKQGG